MRNSKTFLATSVVISVILGAGAASAADLPARTYAPVVVDPSYNWAGAYIGGNVGGVWSQTNFTDTANPPGFPSSGPTINAFGTNKFTHSGFTGGGQVGYNWQASQYVAGLEADIQYTDVKGAFAGVDGLGTIYTDAYKSNWLATFRGRMGVTSGPVLFYATGGLAVANVNYADLLVFPASATFNGASTNITRAGYAVGGGLEWMIDRNWSVKGECVYVDLGTTTYVSANSAPLTFPVSTIQHDHRIQEDIGRIGVNYRWGAPVVARY